MPVLSRPIRRKATAPTQREVRIPLQRTEPEGPELQPSPQTTQPAPKPDRRARTIKLVGGGLAVALAVGVGAYALLEDDGAGTVNEPSVTAVPPADSTAVTQAEVAAAQAQRLRNSGDAATSIAGSSTTATSGSSTTPTEAEVAAAQAQRLRSSGDAATSISAVSDPERLSEAQRNAEIKRRTENFTP